MSPTDSSAGSYPGNPSLPVEVREKILMTFRHALGLFSSGHVNDCLIGCEFILKMDPRFTPARRLQEKARNRDSDVDISELQALANPAGGTGSPAPAPPAPARPTSPQAAARPTSAPAPARPAPAPAARPTSVTAPPVAPSAEKPDAERLLAKAGLMYAERDFEGAIAMASRALAILPGNREALALVERAAGKKATQPLVESSLAHAEQAIEGGRLPEARLELERIRALDAEHPAIAGLATRLGQSEAAPGGSPAPQADFSLDHEAPAAFPAGGFRGSESGPQMGGESNEPAGLDPFASHPAPFGEIGLPESYEASSAMEPPSPSEEALVPPQPPSPDLFLSLEAEGGAPTLPVGSTDEEESRAAVQEIDALLKQGDEVSKKGDRQQAIEIWSRVFLIDINNAEAVTRIEKARQEMAEEGRMVADLLKKGRASFEAGDRDAARQFFHQAQTLDPDEATARYYLERIEQGPAEPMAAAAAKAAPSAREEEPLAAAPAAAPAAPARRKIGLQIQPRVLAVVGVFLAMTLVGIYFVFRGKSQESPQRIVSAGSLQRAQELLGQGKIAEARAELRRIGPGDPNSDEAQRMLTELGRSGAPEAARKAPEASGPAGAASREARGETDPARLRASAEKALAEKRYIEALKNFNLAAPAFRDDPSFAQAQGVAAEKVTALTPAVKLYNEGEYETAIPILWRIVQEDRNNQDARSYLLRSYYNQGISQLQNGLYIKAMQAFQEALALDPNDAEAARHRKFAEHYQKGDLDLMARIYVRHLNHRP